MPPVNRLAPPAANSFAEYGPYGPVTSDPAASAAYQQQLMSGVGAGLANQLRGMYQTAQRMATSRPIDDIRAALASLAALYDDPMQALQALRDMRQRAMSGPQGLGQVLGELAPLPGPRSMPNAMKIDAPPKNVANIRSKTDTKRVKDVAARIDSALGNRQPLATNVQNEMKLATSVLRAKNPQVVEDWIQTYYNQNVPLEQFETATAKLRAVLPPQTVDALIENAGAFNSAADFKAFLQSTPAKRSEWWQKWSK